MEHKRKIHDSFHDLLHYGSTAYGFLSKKDYDDKNIDEAKRILFKICHICEGELLNDMKRKRRND